MPRVSVVMGIYNIQQQDDELRSAVDSILNQSFKDFEIIMCDDGSTDNTYSILNRLYGGNDKIRIIKNDRNLGLAASLNNCILNSAGEYIARMDADDISVETRLEKQVSFLDENPDISFVGSNVFLFEGENYWGQRECPRYPQREDFLFKAPFIHPTIMYRKSVLETVGYYRVCKETLRCEDYDIYMRLYKNHFYGSNLQEFLFCVREDAAAFKRRKYRYRLDEAKVRYDGFKGLNLMPKGMLYVIKPLLVGLIPQKLLKKLKKEKRSV